MTIFFFSKARTRGLPDDLSGPVRIVRIGIDQEPLDSNLCCGTHVSNLSQLQAVKLLGVEKAKREDRSNLHFLVGRRVLAYLHGCHKREEVGRGGVWRACEPQTKNNHNHLACISQALTAALNGGPEDHASLAEKLVKNLKVASKAQQNLTKELATRDAQEVNGSQGSKYFVWHR